MWMKCKIQAYHPHGITTVWHVGVLTGSSVTLLSFQTKYSCPLHLLLCMGFELKTLPGCLICCVPGYRHEKAWYLRFSTSIFCLTRALNSWIFTPPLGLCALFSINHFSTWRCSSFHVVSRSQAEFDISVRSPHRKVSFLCCFSLLWWHRPSGLWILWWNSHLLLSCIGLALIAKADAWHIHFLYDR